MTWIKDENGNRCSVEYWGSEEAARKALASLEKPRWKICGNWRSPNSHATT